jgi:isopenicillin N synthase-like dioxygenase
MAGIPLIDLAPLRQGGPSGLARVASEIHRACVEVGFLYVVGHGVPQRLVEDAFAQSARFHAQPLEVKQKLTINPFHRGYLGLASYALNERLRPNLSESLVIMHELPPDDPDLLAGKPLQGPNQWPDLPGWRDTILSYNRALEDLGRALLPAFAGALELPADYFEAMFRKPTTFLRLLHYPPQSPAAPDNEFGSAPHTDYGCITILAQDETGGLEVRRRGGEWAAAPPIPGSFVVNLGDMMARWTNDRFVSTPHRVVNSSGRDRYSIAFFFDPNLETVVSCLPSCLEPQGAPRYPPGLRRVFARSA